jgi:copper chaperone CopZ
VSCVKKVRETFEQMDEVAAVAVDFDGKTATVTAKPGKTLTRAAVENAFAGSTYGVTTFVDRAGG